MRNKEILKLVAGFRRFRDKYYNEHTSLYERLSSTGQTPKTLIIGCSDSRVDPALISSASPGDLFVVRNVANLVPPCESMVGVHGVSSAIEFAVVNLKVENVVILGHRQCGGIRSLMLDQNPKEQSFIGSWMRIAQRAKDHVLANFSGADEETLCRQCELESIRISLENLRTFPFVRKAMEDRGMSLIGVYFDLEKGHLMEFDEEINQFKII